MRHEQLERVVVLYAVLKSNHRAAKLPDITHDVCERMGTDYCPRTVRRDLDALERLGLAEKHGKAWALVGPLSFFEAASVMLAKRGAA